MPKNIDHLTEDTPIPNQLWCCISFISPETLKNCNFRAMKVRGVFSTREEATKRAEYLQQIDPDFNIYVGEVGKWLGWEPDPNTIDDQVYREKKLQDIVEGYKKQREKAKVLEEERKRELVEESVRNEAAKSNKKNNKVQAERDRLRRKLETQNQDKKIKSMEENRFKSGQISGDDSNTTNQEVTSTSQTENSDKSNNIKAKEELISAEKQRISKNEQIINQSKAELGTVDQKLNELQAHYKLLLEKKKRKTAVPATTG